MAVRMSGLVSNLDTEGIVKSLMSVQRLKSKKLDNKITKLEWKQEGWKALNTKIYSFYTDSLSKLRMQSSFLTKKVSSSNESKATVISSNAAPEGTHSLKIQELASSQFETGNIVATDKNSKAVSTSTLLTDLNMSVGNTITVNAGGADKSLTITATTTVGEFISTLRDAGLNASYDTNQHRFFISSKQSGNANAFSLTATTPSQLSGLGLSQITKTVNGDGTYTVTGGTANLIKPQDATFIYNGVQMTSSSNNISVNGLTVTLKGVTAGLDTPADPSDDEVISLNVSNDTQAVYDTVKSFVTKYNELLKEMNKFYYAESTSGYEPLTEDEKKSMTDDEITKWETKIKDSLLRRDDSLGSLINTVRTKLGESVTVDGKKYALSTYGINTSSDYTEMGLLHIDGDKDDSTTAMSDDKLMAALTSNPDTVMKVMTELAGNLYKSMSESMKSSKLRSTLTFYNDKEIKNTIKDYKKDLKDMEASLLEMENRYYKQFSAMESALSKMNSQSSNLASFMGTGN